MTKDKIREFVKKMAEKAKLSEEEAHELADELLKQSEETKQKFEEKMDERIKKYIGGLGLATKDDVKKIREELQELKGKTE